MNFAEHLLHPSALLDLANVQKFAAISATVLGLKICCQNAHNLTGRSMEEKISTTEATESTEIGNRSKKHFFGVRGFPASVLSAFSVVETFFYHTILRACAKSLLFEN